MNELPDLPRPPRRVRPIPPAGVQTAIAAGRRRRNLFVGTAGGAAAAVVVAAIAAFALPSSGNESLQPADSGRSPSAVVPLSPPSHSAAQVQPVASRAAAAAAAAHRRVAAAPAPSRSTSGQRGSSSRPMYTESPHDVPAPQECRSVPSASAGPVFTGGPSGCSVSSSDDSTVARGGTVSGTVGVCVSYGGAAMQLGWRSGQEHEVVVDDAAGNVVYRFSSTVRFDSIAHRRTIADGRCLEWTGSWNTRDTAGALVPRGRYDVHIIVAPSTVNGHRTGPGEESAGGFSVDVQ
jgi:hypothetical protein